MYDHTFTVACARRVAACLLALALAGGAAAAPVSSVGIAVPHRTGPGQLELSALKITLQLDSSSPIAIQVSEASSGSLATGSMTLTSATNDCFGSLCFANFPNTPGGAAGPDRLTVIKPQQAGADPASSGNNKLVLVLRLASNINEAAACSSTMSANESWTVSVVGGAARITGVAVQSLDKQTTGAANPACGTSFRPVPLNDLPVATVTGQPPLLAGGRVGVDAVMVLDRSGSMSDPVSSAVGAPQKITRLGQATDTFLDMWTALRANECQNFAVNCPANGGSPGVEGPTDRLGVVFFDDAFSWLKTLEPGSAIDGLKNLSTLDLTTEKTQIKAVAPRGSTSIGGGLLLAAPALVPLASEPNRKVILLMTDGMQNTDPLVQTTASQIQTTSTVPPCPVATPCPLPNQPPIQVFGVTVGSGVAVDPTVNQAVANASNGFYLNTEDDASVLPNLFVQVLQNAVKFSSVETLRVVKDQTRFATPFTMQVPVTSGTRSLAFNLNWRANLGVLRVRLQPPSGGKPIDFVGTSATGGSSGLLVGNVAFPRPGVPVTAGTWTVSVTSDNRDNVPVPFDMSLLGDDNTVNSSLVSATAQPVVGGNIKLTAQVNDLDHALVGLGAQAGAQVTAFIVRPGANLGDVLSDSVATPTPPGPNDPGSAAQRKLDAILKANPNALIKASDIVTLQDDGSAASGDGVAGDGIYSALVPANFEGHYNIVFLVQGTSTSGGAFVRQAIRTVHARSLPDASATQTSSAVQGTPPGDQLLAITMTPRNSRGGKMGPGWANYFWFSPPGAAPLKPIDNLDGTYSVKIPFTGTTPPTVPLHFLPDPVVLPDGYVPPPGKLDPGNTVIGDVGGGSAGSSRYAIWLAIGSTFPHGSFDTNYDSGFAGTLGAEFVLAPAWSIEGTLGWHAFSGSGGAQDIDVTQFGIDAKWYATPAPMRWFVTAGAGGYSFDPGKTRFGANVGGGLQYRLTPAWSLEGRYAFHAVAGNAPDSHYSTLQLGVRYGF